MLLTEWKNATMTPDQFQQELKHCRDWCCRLKIKRTVLNQEHFNFVIPDELFPWIEKEVNIPGYKSGVEDFVFVVAKDSNAQLAVMESFDKVKSIYAPRFFLDDNQALQWITSPKKKKVKSEPIQPPTNFDSKVDINFNEDKSKAILQVEMPVDNLPHGLHALKQYKEKMLFMKQNWFKFRSLTKREEVVLKLLVSGLQHSEISEKLYISDKTVKTHRRNIIKKLECKHMVDLYRYADAFGLI